MVGRASIRQGFSNVSRVPVAARLLGTEATMRKCVSYAMAAMLGMTATLSAVKTSTAGAFPVDTVVSKTAAPQDVVKAHYNGGAFFAGAALGLFGAALAAPYYYGAHYYPYYYPGYAYAPYGGYYSYYPGYRYGYWGYPRYRHYGYWGYPRYRYGYRHWW
jgi:hypothetical protein